MRARASAFFLPALVLALLLAGCIGGNDEKQIDRAAVSKLVLARSSLSVARSINSGRWDSDHEAALLFGWQETPQSSKRSLHSFFFRLG